MVKNKKAFSDLSNSLWDQNKYVGNETEKRLYVKLRSKSGLICIFLPSVDSEMRGNHFFPQFLNEVSLEVMCARSWLLYLED